MISIKLNVSSYIYKRDIVVFHYIGMSCVGRKTLIDIQARQFFLVSRNPRMKASNFPRRTCHPSLLFFLFPTFHKTEKMFGVPTGSRFILLLSVSFGLTKKSGLEANIYC